MSTGMSNAVHGWRRSSVRIPREGELRLGHWASWAAFLIPTFLWMEFVLIGRIYLPELMLMALLPVLVVKRGYMLADPLPRTFLLLALSWLMCQILTDVIRESDFQDYSRGWAKIAFTILNFCALYLLLYGSRRRLALFAFGMVIGGYLGPLLNPSVYILGHAWKFGFGPPTALAAVLVTLWRPVAWSWLLSVLLLAAVAAYSLWTGTRALAGVSILAALYICVQQVVGRGGTAAGRTSLARSLLLLAAGAVIATLILELYGYAARAGYLSERAVVTYERQVMGAFGVLLGGRAEIFVSTHAVLDSPIIGHGSWARNPDLGALLLGLRDYGYEIHSLVRAGSDVIPTHSHLMGAWVEAGIMGAVFWSWVLLLVLRVLTSQYMVRDPMGPLVALVGFMMMWDIIFSPFGSARRYIVPFNVVLMMFAWDVLQGRISGWEPRPFLQPAADVAARLVASPSHRGRTDLRGARDRPAAPPALPDLP